MTEQTILGLIVATAVGLAMWRPAVAVMILGVYLFVQSALVRLDALPVQLTATLSRADEILLAALLVRTTYTWLRAGHPPLPKAVWALIAFAAIGIASAVVNGVGPVETGLGIYLAVKAGLWLFVGLYLRVSIKTLARYATVIGALFLAVVGVALLQVAGVALPWQPHHRAGVIAATSIWGFHTAFGGALSVAMGLSVAAYRLPGERFGATVLAVSSVVGVILSTARRLLASLAVGAVAAFLALPVTGRKYVRSLVGMARQRTVLAVLLVTFALAAVAVGPRLVDLATVTWDRYVVKLATRDRYVMYRGAFRLVLQSPLVGRGPSTYGSYASVIVDSPAYNEVGYRRPSTSMVVGGQVASVLAEYGILGFTAFAGFLVLLIRTLLPISRGSSGTVRAALATAGIFMITDMVIESAVNPVFSNSFITFFTFVGIGVAIRLHESARQGSTDDTWEAGLVSPMWRVGSLAAAVLLVAALGGLIAWGVPG